MSKFYYDDYENLSPKEQKEYNKINRDYARDSIPTITSYKQFKYEYEEDIQNVIEECGVGIIRTSGSLYEKMFEKEASGGLCRRCIYCGEPITEFDNGMPKCSCKDSMIGIDNIDDDSIIF